jgi:hypothetical protein
MNDADFDLLNRPVFHDGDVVFVESTKPISKEHIHEIGENATRIFERTGVHIVVLEEGLRIARVGFVERLKELVQEWADNAKGGIDEYEVDKFVQWLDDRTRRTGDHS